MLKTSLIAFLLAVTTAGMADEPRYKLRMDASVQGSQLTVVPSIVAPAGAQLRYEVVSTKEGASGKSSTSQGGRVKVGEGGSATLSKLSLGVGAQDRYVITVKVFEGAKLVAEEVLRHPK